MLKSMRYDVVMGLGFSIMKLIIYELFFGLNIGSFSGVLIGFVSVLAVISVLCVLFKLYKSWDEGKRI